jgi:hypothetical protein
MMLAPREARWILRLSYLSRIATEAAFVLLQLRLVFFKRWLPFALGITLLSLLICKTTWNPAANLRVSVLLLSAIGVGNVFLKQLL